MHTLHSKEFFTLILISILFFSPGRVFSQEYSLACLFRFTIKEKRLELVKQDLIEGAAPTYTLQPEDGYVFKMLKADETEIYITRFTIPILPSGDYPAKEWFNEKGEQVVIPNEPIAKPTVSVFPLVVPYLASASTIEVYDPANTLVLRAAIPPQEVLVDTLLKDEQLIKIQPPQEKEEVAKQQEPNFFKRDLLILLLGIVGLGGVGLIIWAFSTLRRKK